MEFEEQNIKAIRDLSLGHFVITTVKPNVNISYNNQKQLITEFIKTKYFIWNHHIEPNGQNVVLTHENGKTTSYFNEKFFGFYETEKLNFADFEKIDFFKFKTNIETQILKETNSDFFNNCSQIIQNLNPKSVFYFLNPPDNKIPQIVKDWSIYVFFYSYLNIDEEKNEMNLIEFGLD